MSPKVGSSDLQPIADPDVTCQQRAAHVTYMLTLRALAGTEGRTPGLVTDLR